ncbi:MULTISPECIES: HDOD domain-containing protein [unclassified Undibacterium]|uniref:HDOD domain-containing protein n=1 Tax=unclassified Undibacterium TaxID=2630295 RepID=UPI002AC98078|nr:MULTISPECIES: HDOD domain-containing protein [unclassified Undibacterium]MEB0140508.1 HDOD domain-containing protein [Undibacterium sp. CCC2.1]MEB0173515.1 HDOD domain-containing protein [Undibacterium sp. CCC1.1]MEB0177501.1 HDOD domain-containing protein [Undibacterium sp. CCC3.4]MEB0216633.1 HDOD domain-containing protein [Undibacterium sp. 5I2]WPX42350.1 HDOD domain-containing protein [Undibacterium sp. CCC3.4]
MTRSKALKSIIEQANQGDLVFPTNVAATLKIQQALDDPDCVVDSATKLIMNEPLLAARVVAIANSAAYSRGSDVTNVKAAINRLGFRSLRTIVATIIVRQLAGTSKEPAIVAMTQKLWEHTAQVAALSQVIARRITRLDPDTAMFSGIVHEVGNFYLLSRAEEFPALLEPEQPAEISEDLPEFADTIVDIESTESIIGRAVIKNLQLPQAVVVALEALWFGLRAMPPETLGDTILLANELARTQSPLDFNSYSESERFSSEIDFVVGDGTLNSILEESDEELRSLTAALMA